MKLRERIEKIIPLMVLKPKKGILGEITVAAWGLAIMLLGGVLPFVIAGNIACGVRGIDAIYMIMVNLSLITALFLLTWWYNSDSGELK